MRCDWAKNNPLLQKYHDEEWGVPVHDDRLLFEHLSLDVFQAGLSWLTILNKRENFRNAFDNFEISKVSLYDKNKVEELINNPGIIRNRMKVEATIENANCVLSLQKEYGSFDRFIWQFTKGTSKHNSFEKQSELPAVSAESDAMSRELRRLGFKFLGSTICYAFMQATGMINDHITSCFRYSAIKK